MQPPEFTFDENLREAVHDEAYTHSYVTHLKSQMESASDPKTRVSLLGEIGVWLRILGDLENAEKFLNDALDLAYSAKLGVAIEVQQRIRLAHVWQCQERFTQSEEEFSKLLAVCQSEPQARHYLAFAWQHLGKCYFDQGLSYSKAMACFESALEIRETTGAPEEQIESSRIALARARARYARRE